MMSPSAKSNERIYLSSPHMGGHEQKFVAEAFETNWIAPLGPNVDTFEAETANYIGVKAATATSSGTAALHLALRVLGVGRGDLVFVSSLTFIGSVNPILYDGAEPVFIDSNEESWNMCPLALERAFLWAQEKGRLPKAVIVVNLYGQSAQFDKILPLCRKYGVPVIEDAAESLGATYMGKPSGSFGDLSILSFNGNKIITTSGGGMLLSNNSTWIDKARFLSTQARDPAPHYQHSEMGFNYRMSNVLAGIGRGQLLVLDERVAARRKVFARYVEALGEFPGFKFMPEISNGKSTRWLTTLTIDSLSPTPSSIIAALAAENIESRPVWKPLHMQPLFSGTQFFGQQSSFDVSKRLFEHGICLPSGSNLPNHDQLRVIEIIRALKL
jgi:pyridoxal phosphate-dependent aminotransferase EpsN